MLMLDDETYRETKNIVLGKQKKMPILMDLADWFREKYSVEVLNMQFSRLGNSLTGRHRLYIIIARTEDYNRMYISFLKPDEKIQMETADEFRKLSLKYKFTEEANLKDLFVIYNDFSEEARTNANWSAEKEVKEHLKNNYPIVWDVISLFSGSVVFYRSDLEIAVNENNGINRAITDSYYVILKKYDELAYFTRENINLKFDSKENLDLNYQGNLFYYMRG